MPVPIPAKMACAAVRLMPGISSSLATVSAKGVICSSILASRAATSLLIASTRASILPSRNA
jgi:hypothetical protein